MQEFTIPGRLIPLFVYSMDKNGRERPRITKNNTFILPNNLYLSVYSYQEKEAILYDYDGLTVKKVSIIKNILNQDNDLFLRNKLNEKFLSIDKSKIWRKNFCKGDFTNDYTVFAVCGSKSWAKQFVNLFADDSSIVIFNKTKAKYALKIDGLNRKTLLDLFFLDREGNKIAVIVNNNPVKTEDTVIKLIVLDNPLSF